MFLIIVAVAIRDLANDLGIVEDTTNLDEFIVWVLAGIGVILLVVAGINALIFI